MPTTRSFQSELCSLFGYPVAENPTQVMIEAAFRDLGLDWRYLTIEVQPNHLENAVRGFRAMGFRGGNCTLPHKVAVIPFLDELTPAARDIGAVNCIMAHENRLIGENTDGKGFLQSVQAIDTPTDKRVTLLGAGGAARAIAVELLRARVGHLTLVNRSVERGQALAEHLNRLFPNRVTLESWNGDYPIPADCQWLINSTSIGLFPNVSERVPVVRDSFRPDLLVCDVIPNPPMTAFLTEATAAGCRTLDGLGMLVNQGVIGIKCWTGRDANPEVMRAALERVFSE
ncbi:shikimate dehydrogenase [Tuwongella immobilis]|uniref:Shikimate dehydrogenase (NADP(+)) n=1 Tax=Tuwongella immobilis TaxID=692036 RepID=A0A6C2YP99_9BACT|nr:shikimate dehydrogenase [Tuwongella immobilis]VIP03450.1 shikimate dehydrogenase : Shikimate dehydrogenase (NADP(+)) OS=Planctomyces maris DSM 8797 GN=aroE PE=3 SV=1: Shikimate_dh_N: Shikimate_DH [Tuwongella immobilis]VTS04272.1 shikimate dehydrogenase : Shikimate dehydrogenase (NADP(+)) OS=Planctomyces maris DSM 8797 GN=aroE PE=3 SV=1: Shikimate_dh_N: Shikimate_DH [Tuwongella immobilis]